MNKSRRKRDNHACNCLVLTNRTQRVVCCPLSLPCCLCLVSPQCIEPLDDLVAVLRHWPILTTIIYSGKDMVSSRTSAGDRLLCTLCAKYTNDINVCVWAVDVKLWHKAAVHFLIAKNDCTGRLANKLLTNHDYA